MGDERVNGYLRLIYSLVLCVSEADRVDDRSIRFAVVEDRGQDNAAGAHIVYCQQLTNTFQDF